VDRKVRRLTAALEVAITPRKAPEATAEKAPEHPNRAALRKDPNAVCEIVEDRIIRLMKALAEETRGVGKVPSSRRESLAGAALSWKRNCADTQVQAQLQHELAASQEQLARHTGEVWGRTDPAGGTGQGITVGPGRGGGSGQTADSSVGRRDPTSGSR